MIKHFFGQVPDKERGWKLQSGDQVGRDVGCWRMDLQDRRRVRQGGQGHHQLQAGDGGVPARLHQPAAGQERGRRRDCHLRD